MQGSDWIFHRTGTVFSCFLLMTTFHNRGSLSLIFSCVVIWKHVHQAVGTMPLKILILVGSCLHLSLCAALTAQWQT